MVGAPTYHPRVRALVLGPLRVCVDGEEAGIRSVRRRNLLAALTVDVGRMVPTTRLMEALWGASPPDSAQAALQVHLSELRSTLQPDRPPRDEGRYIQTVPEGYRLVLRTGQLDRTRFEHLARQGRRHRSEGRHADAEHVLHEALRAWAGDAYADCSDVAPDHVRWLEDLRLDVEDDLFAATLAAGGTERVVADLAAAAERTPFRERRAALLVLALYRLGRQRDALGTYEQVRARLLDEMGCEPGRELETLHLAVLRQDPGLDGLTLAPPRTVVVSPRAAGRDGAVRVGGTEEGVAVAEAVLSEVGEVVRRQPEEVVLVGDAAALQAAAADEAAIPGSPFAATEQAWSEGGERSRPRGVASVPAGDPPPRHARAASAPLLGHAPLLGRDDDLARLRDLVAEHRFVSVVGPPGVGTSALVAAVVGTRPDAVVLDGAAATGSGRLLQALRDRLGLVEHPLRDPVDEAALALEGHVLVLDGCDATRDEAAALVGELAAANPGLSVVAAGRRRLGLPDEHAIELAPLAVPGPDAARAELVTAPALQLLASRAEVDLHALEPHELAELAELAGLLDGLPLALELAAPALRSLGAAGLRDRLDRSARLLSGGSDGADDLEQVIATSYGWLSDRAALLLDRLSVFAAPVALDDVEEVCADDRLAVDEVAVALSELVDGSLVHREVEPDGLTYRTLATVRRAARRRLEASGESDALHDRHAAHLARVLGRTGLSIAGRGGMGARRRVERGLADLRDVLAWYRRGGRVDDQLELAGRLAFFWFSTGRIGEGRATCDEALRAGGSPAARAGCLAAAAFLAWWQGDYAAVRAHLEEALADPGPGEPPVLQAIAEASLAWATGDVDGAEGPIADALDAATRSGRDWEVAVAASMAGNIAWYRGEHEQAADRYRRAADVGRWIDNPMVSGLARRGEALNLALAGRQTEAEQAADAALADAAALGDPLSEGQARTFAALVALEADEPDADGRTSRLLVEGLARSAQVMDVMGLVLAGGGLLAVADRDGDHERAAVLHGWLDGVLALTGLPLPPRERARREAAHARALAGMGEDRLRAARDRGRAMAPDQVVALVGAP